jgi:hypothetical protein
MLRGKHGTSSEYELGLLTTEALCSVSVVDQYEEDAAIQIFSTFFE